MLYIKSAIHSLKNIGNPKHVILYLIVKTETEVMTNPINIYMCTKEEMHKNNFGF